MKYVWTAILLCVALTITGYFLWPRRQGNEPRIIKVTGEFTGMPKPAAESSVTLAQFNQLEVGMTFEKVKEIVGEGGLPIAVDGFRGPTGKKEFTTLVEWKNSDGSVLSARFTNYKLVSKNQHGLK